MITLEEAKEFICVDHDLDDALIQSFVATADEYLLGALGKDCPEEVLHSERANLIRKLMARDMYDNRKLSSDRKEQIRDYVRSMIKQMQAEALPE